MLSEALEGLAWTVRCPLGEVGYVQKEGAAISSRRAPCPASREGAALLGCWEQLLQAVLGLPCWYSSVQGGSSHLCKWKYSQVKSGSFLLLCDGNLHRVGSWFLSTVSQSRVPWTIRWIRIVAELWLWCFLLQRNCKLLLHTKSYFRS